MNPPWLILVIFAMLIFPGARQHPPRQGVFPALAAPVRRQLGCGLWAFAPGAEDKLNRLTKRPILPLIDQLEAIDVPRKWGEVIGDFGLSWRAMHSQAGAYIRR